MNPGEVLEVVTDENEMVVELKGSQELFAKMGPDQFKGVKRTVREPVMITLALPELDDESN